MKSFTEKQVRKQLGDFNNENQCIEWCVQDMRLANEQLKKTIANATVEIAVTNKLVVEQMEAIERQRRVIGELEGEVHDVTMRLSGMRALSGGTL
jgi:hypothetical protein